MAAGSGQANGVPYRIDLHAVARQDRHPRQGFAAFRQDADAKYRGSHAAAGESPTATDAIAAVGQHRFLRRENTASKHHVRAVAVKCFQGVRRQRAEVKRAHTKAGNPACGAIGGRDLLDKLAELCRGALLAAVDFGDERPVDANLLKPGDDVVRDMALLLEIGAAGRNILQQWNEFLTNMNG